MGEGSINLHQGPTKLLDRLNLKHQLQILPQRFILGKQLVQWDLTHLHLPQKYCLMLDMHFVQQSLT